jgi:hypothetical protein
MQTTTLGPLTVSRLALGAMLMGGRTPRAEGERDGLEAPAPPPAIYPQRMLREQIGMDAMPPLRRR